MKLDAKIYVAGHRGLVGSALVKTLQSKGYNNIIVRTHTELDLIDSRAVATFFEEQKPDYVFLAAAKVGGIVANDSEQCGPSKLPEWRKKIDVFGQYMYLSKGMSATHEGRLLADRCFGVHQ